MCYQPVDPGNCTERNIAFFYDIEKRACTSFIYTGCGGNENRFNSEEQCERQCGMFRGQGKTPNGIIGLVSYLRGLFKCMISLKCFM